MDFTSVILPQIVLDLGMIVVLEFIVMSIIFVEIMTHCIGKIDWDNFSNSFSVIMDSFFWLSLGSDLLNASCSWHEPILTLGHWEPNILIFLSHFLHEVNWLWEIC